MKGYKKGILLSWVVLVVATSTTIVTLPSQNQISDKTNSPALQQQKADPEDRLPAVDFESPEPSDPKKRAERREKNTRHDNSHLVRKGDGSGNATETTLVNEWDLGLPPLPVAQSEIILRGEVTEAHAHLSNDKTGIYSEFRVNVEEVLKNVGSASLIAGSPIHLERIGGAVRYPNGRKHLYRIAGQNMPRVGFRYVFFLKLAGEDQACEIITAYELRGSKIFPLDAAGQFDAYKGMEEASFLEALKNAVARQ